MRLIYIAHPFGGQQENVEKVEKIIKGLLHKHPDCTFYSPLHATLIGAYQFASYCPAKGWIIEEWPEWDKANVRYWMPLPEPPKEDI